jgi:alpha-L-fucosidase
MAGEWFNQARFGMFIHWGPYSLHGRCVWARYRERMPSSEYEKLAEGFDAARYRPETWVEEAKRAGMRYMVLCTRQHPGYSLFDSKVSDFTAAKMAPGRDLVSEYVEACREAGMKIGFYYSLLDWRFPAYFSGPKADPKGWAEFLEYVHSQIEELCTNYGKIDVLWYDGWWPWKAEDWKSRELNEKVRSLQPDILINNRSGLAEDFGTPEQYISSEADPNRKWESCMTMNDTWGYSPGDVDWKSPRELVHRLVLSVSIGGNLLLDVGPKPDGTFPREATTRLNAVGRWMDTNGESIYGAGRCPINRVDSGRLKEDTLLSKMGVTTSKGATIYLHVFHWPGRELTIGNVKNKALLARVLAAGRNPDILQEEDRITLRGLPARPPDPYDSVIALELDGAPEGYPDFRFIP